RRRGEREYGGADPVQRELRGVGTPPAEGARDREGRPRCRIDLPERLRWSRWPFPDACGVGLPAGAEGPRPPTAGVVSGAKRLRRRRRHVPHVVDHLGDLVADLHGQRAQSGRRVLDACTQDGVAEHPHDGISTFGVQLYPLLAVPPMRGGQVVEGDAALVVAVLFEVLDVRLAVGPPTPSIICAWFDESGFTAGSSS